ncbi:Phage-related baseplate assembly protein [compost metagenome]
MDERDGVESYWIHVPQRHTQATQRRPLLPEIGEQVAVLLDAEGVNGVYLGGIYSTAEPPPVVDQDSHFIRFSDGTSVTYQRKTHQLTVDCVGSAKVHYASNITVNAGGNIDATAGGSISVTAGGAVTVKASGPASVTAPEITLTAGTTTVKGDLEVMGNTKVAGNVNAGGSVMDAGGNSNHHKH